MMRTKLWTSLVPAAMLLVSWTPREADACGGTFCDGGPNAMPVDQTGENILFAMGDGYTEAHIQIQYDPTTEANQFAWVVPMTAVPAFTVGSQQLFDNILAGTVPAYGFNYQFDDCGAVDDSGGDSNAGSSATDPSGGESGSDSDTGPTVVLQQTVGAFDITVLEGGTAAEVMEWLGTNGYQQDPNAEPILAEYLAENYIFAAFKLTNGAETAEIHPITLRFDTEEACVPLRLTRIAAIEDMEIRTFFLAESRVVPQTYRHVVINPLKLDWPNFAANYKDVITLAVDAFGAEGKAFVTEYAGSSAIVAPDGLFSESWSSAAFANLPATDVVDTLTAQGFGYCDEFEGCVWNHALVPGLLASFLPVPDGVDPTEFYLCLTCYADQIDLETWGDGTEFAAALEQRIVQPGAHALDLLATFPTLTRMFTTISPAEMTTDPFFWQNPGLPEVDLTQSVATRRVLCNSDAVWTLPDGREVYVPNDGAWPAFQTEMPWEEEVSEMPANGAPIALVDNRVLIDTQLATYNCALGWPANGCGSSGETGGTGSDTGGSSASASGGSDADESGESGGGSGTIGQDGEAGGCGCTAAPRSASPLLGLALLALRRRRSR